MAYDFTTAEDDILESPWGSESANVQDAEWNRISSDFTNAGYREGITAGKEAALQEGFNAGYALVGIPLGYELGLLRGHASALHSFLTAFSATDAQIAEARAIMDGLAAVRFTDIAPRDIEAEQHAREHLETTGESLDENEEVIERRHIEQLEDMMSALSPSAVLARDAQRRPTADDVKMLKVRLESLSDTTCIALCPRNS